MLPWGLNDATHASGCSRWCSVGAQHWVLSDQRTQAFLNNEREREREILGLSEVELHARALVACIQRDGCCPRY